MDTHRNGAKQQQKGGGGKERKTNQRVRRRRIKRTKRGRNEKSVGRSVERDPSSGLESVWNLNGIKDMVSPGCQSVSQPVGAVASLVVHSLPRPSVCRAMGRHALRPFILHSTHAWIYIKEIPTPPPASSAFFAPAGRDCQTDPKTKKRQQRTDNAFHEKS